MGKIITPAEAVAKQPDFFTKKPEGVSWTLSVEIPEGEKEFVGVSWKAESRFGKVESAVVTDENGNPLFDRPRYYEAPNVNVVAWGRDNRTGEIKIAVIVEERPHALHPEIPEKEVALKFAQIPMGFIEKIVGKDNVGILEIGKHAAAREVAEETGASAVRGISRPACPYHNPSPSFVATWSELYFIEVDLDRIGALKLDRNEPIFKAEYLNVKELLARIREGQDAEGAIFRGATSLSALMIFFSQNPEFWPR